MDNNIPQSDAPIQSAPDMAQTAPSMTETAPVAQVVTPTPVAIESGSGMKIVIAAVIVILLGVIGWLFFTKMNDMSETNPPVQLTPAAQVSVPAEKAAPAVASDTSVSGSATATASADMKDLDGIESDMTTLDSDLSAFDTTGIQ